MIKNSEVFAREGSPYSVELVLFETDQAGRKTAQAVPVERMGRRKQPFAGIPNDRVFAVRLRNYSSIEASVNLSLDGISSFAFSKVRTTAATWLVPPAKSNNEPGEVLILGWDLNNEVSFAFKTVGYPESAARELNIEPNEAMGQICAQFSESYEVGQAGARSVGRGEPIDSAKTAVQRELGPLRATVHVRYKRALEDEE